MTPGTRMLLDCHPLKRHEPEETQHPREPRQPFTFRDIAVTARCGHSAYGACALFSGEERPCCTAAISGCTDGRRAPQAAASAGGLPVAGRHQHRGREGVRKRTALEERFAWAFTKAAGSLHLVWCSSQNIDRMVTLYKACLQSRRRLVVDPYTAVVLDRVAGLSPTIPNVLGFDRVKVYYPKKLTTYLHNKYGSRYTTYLQPGVNKVTYKDLMENPGRT